MNASAPTQSSGGVTCAAGRVVSLIVVALFSLVTTATMQAQNSPIRVEEFSLEPGGGVKVENPSGAIRVEAWRGSTVRVIAEKTAPAGSSLGPADLMLMGAGNTVIVQCRLAGGAGRIDLTVMVPQLSELQVTGGGAPVNVSGALASAIVQTTSGQIDYRIPADDDARISMRTSRGTVKTTVPLAVTERSAQSVQGQLRNGSATIVLASQSGNITLTPGPNAGLSAQNVAATAPEPAGQARTTDNDRNSYPRQQSRQSADPDDEAFKTGGRSSGSNSRGNAGSSAGSNGSFVFAGSDQGVSSDQTTKGRGVHPRTEKTTGGGGSGLKVRIIPADAPPNASSTGLDSDVDDQSLDPDFDSGKQKARKKGSSGTSTSDPDAAAAQSTGGFVFAGSDQSVVGEQTVKSRTGMRPSEKKQTGGGNSGLKIRIIPAPPAAHPDVDTITMGGRSTSSRSSSTVSDSGASRPGVYSSSSPAPAPAPRFDRQPGAVASAQDDSVEDEPARTRPVPRQAMQRNNPADDREFASVFPGPNSAPSLRRGEVEDPGDSSSDPRDTSSRAGSSEDEAVVLKAALVNLNVSVTNRSGLALPGLKKEDFQVAENGAQQKIEFFQPATAPFNLVLLLDLSGSIQEKLDIVKSAALRFVDVIGPQDKVAVITFTDRIAVVSQLTSDRDELKRRIRSIERPMGGTAFYEALWFALVDTFRATRGQRNAIVVMTDGVDSSLDRYNPANTRVTFAQLSRRLEEADVMVFPIYLDTEYEEVFERGNSTSEAYAVAREQLQKIAEQTGGQLFQAEKASDLSNVYKQVAAAMRTVYSVGYYPTNAEKDGTFRRVRVSVDRSDAAVRTKRGYYAK